LERAGPAVQRYFIESLPTEMLAADRDDISADSRSEAERLRARNEELENKVRRLEIENAGLRSKVDELKAELAKRSPPADDGLDIPASLRRVP
jgi:predicted RNase H-like nuclease (RuvC/YqgF family)